MPRRANGVSTFWSFGLLAAVVEVDWATSWEETANQESFVLLNIEPMNVVRFLFQALANIFGTTVLDKVVTTDESYEAS